MTGKFRLTIDIEADDGGGPRKVSASTEFEFDKDDYPVSELIAKDMAHLLRTIGPYVVRGDDAGVCNSFEEEFMDRGNL
ncbi:MAG: hypothetical protein ACKV0T_27830 [Planctomycetales bacterium]